MKKTYPVPPASTAATRLRLDVAGRVQGVGFRPAVVQAARAFGLNGWVGNARAGVRIEVEGDGERVEQFRRQWRGRMPALARIDAVTETVQPVEGATAFVIRASERGGRLTLVPPDLALCPVCRRELFDAGNRRFRYPFINCTACGPRYSIAEALPYDRANTVMRHFPPCPDCTAEYEDAGDRRFHHQTITCATCGPQLTYLDTNGTPLAQREAALRLTVERLRAGAILAVKGLGGFHLMVDAQNDAAVGRLRAFKQRPAKPFAVMFPDLASLAAVCTLQPDEADTLQDSASPLLLCDWNGQGVAPRVAPGQRRLGVMLPYTPLHALLLHDFGGPLVATSGNRGGEPICIDEARAPDVFAGLVDGLLVHDRPIVRGVDDTVAQWADGALRLLRRARGWVPEPVRLPAPVAPLLAVGGHLKTTVALAAGREVVVSSHIGDLDTGPARDLHAQTAGDLARLLETAPQAVLHDAHPDYASTQWAQRCGVPARALQHHLAHLAGCALEYGLPLPVAGCVWDGSGLGPDGQLWGGESLLLEATGWRRTAHLRPFMLPGGERAAREPRRCLLGVLLQVLGDAAWQHPVVVAQFSTTELRLVRLAVQRELNCPLTTSAGRLFDAVSSLLGLCQQQSFEGEAAMALQALAETAPAAAPLPGLPIDGEELDWRPLLQALVQHSAAGADPAALARGFHQRLADCIVAQARAGGASRWLLSGGCFNNRLLLHLSGSGLRAAGIEVFAPRSFPPGDGGLALGQIALALLHPA